MRASLLLILVILTVSPSAAAQDQGGPPRVVAWSDVLVTTAGTPRTTPALLTLTIYDQEADGRALWSEQQTVTPDARGAYSLLLGSTTAEGLPASIFTDGAARWLGVRVDQEPERPRVRLVSVPYALKAADADTLGGRPASAYVVSTDSPKKTATASTKADSPLTNLQFDDSLFINHGANIGVKLSGSTNHLVLHDTAEADSGSNWWYLWRTGGDGKLRFFHNGADRVVFDGNGQVGVGTLVPAARVHLAAPSNHLVFQDTTEANNGNNYWYQYRTGGDGKLRFWHNGTDQIVFDGAGRVGIGTAAPDSALHVPAPIGSHTAKFLAPTTASTLVAGTAGVTDAGSSDGVALIATSGSGSTAHGVIGWAGGSGRGVYGIGTTGPAGYFLGNVTVTGTLTKGGGAFKIDHPLDPANKYLYHSFVESPDMMNVYNGNVTLDAAGEAWVTLPDYFEALNRDFRYQLTAIGAPGPNLYIAQEVSGNRFKIAGGTASGRVSWQVTGVRQDAYANAHRIVVEEDKPEAERGRYAYPSLFGEPDDRKLDSGVRVVQKQ